MLLFCFLFLFTSFSCSHASVHFPVISPVVADEPELKQQNPREVDIVDDIDTDHLNLEEVPADPDEDDDEEEDEAEEIQRTLRMAKEQRGMLGSCL